MQAPDFLAHDLQALLEGRARLRFSAWFNKNQAALKAALRPADFSRLKFKPIEFAEHFLAQQGLPCEKNEAAIATERFLLQFSPDFLDEQGELKEKLFDLYGGVVKKYQQGDRPGANQTIAAILEQTNGTHSHLTQATQEFVYFSQTLAHLDRGLAVFLLSSSQRYFQQKGLVFSLLDAALKQASAEDGA